MRCDAKNGPGTLAGHFDVGSHRSAAESQAVLQRRSTTEQFEGPDHTYWDGQSRDWVVSD